MGIYLVRCTCYLYFIFLIDRKFRDVARKKKTRAAYYLPKKKMYSPFEVDGFFLRYKDISVFHTFPEDGSYCEICIANPIDVLCNWQQPEWGFTKYDAHVTCLVYTCIFFSRSTVQKLLKNTLNIICQTINFGTWQNAFSRPRSDSSLWFNIFPRL